jgi:predicted nucleotidyltransferase
VQRANPLSPVKSTDERSEESATCPSRRRRSFCWRYLKGGCCIISLSIVVKMETFIYKRFLFKLIMGNEEFEQKVEVELGKLVELILDSIPAVKEVRIFGSYITGGWNPQISDVDVFVESDNELYSVFLPSRFDYGQRQKTQEEFTLRMTQKNFSSPFEVHWFTSEDVNRLSMRDQGRGSLGRNMKAGRLLYSLPEICYKEINLDEKILKRTLLYK